VSQRTRAMALLLSSATPDWTFLSSAGRSNHLLLGDGPAGSANAESRWPPTQAVGAAGGGTEALLGRMRRFIESHRTGTKYGLFQSL